MSYACGGYYSPVRPGRNALEGAALGVEAGRMRTVVHHRPDASAGIRATRAARSVVQRTRSALLGAVSATRCGDLNRTKRTAS
jgi:hypothetical protein